MSEDEGKTAVGNTGDMPPAEPAPETAPQDVDESLPPQFAGKTKEELARMVQEKEDFIQRQADEVGKSRNEAEFWRQRVNMGPQSQPQAGYNPYQPQVGMQGQPQVNYEELDNRFLTNPTQTIMDVLGNFANQQRYSNAFRDAPNARAIAQTKYPKVFEGVSDAELNETMNNWLQMGSPPEVLASPESWKDVAWSIKGQKMNYSFPAPERPQAPIVPTETPSQTRPTPKEGGEVPSRLAEMAKEAGLTPEQLEKVNKKISGGGGN